MPDNIAIIVQSVAVLMSAIGVAATIIWNRNVARRKATIDMFLTEQTNQVLLVFRGQYLDAVRKGNLDLLAGDKWYTPETFFLVSTMNRYEITAIGISEGIIDRRICKRYWRATLVRDWIRCKQAANKQRETLENPHLFEEFERLACKWANTEESARL